MAVAISLIYSLARVVNFAVGQFLTVTAFALFLLTDVSGRNPLHDHLGWPFLLAVPVVILGMGVLGYVLEAGLFRPTLRYPINGFVVSFALVSIFQAGFIQIFSTNPYGLPVLFPGKVTVAGAVISYERIVTIAVASISIVVLWLFLVRTNSGRAMRAMAESRESCILIGLPTGRLTSQAFVAGAMLAAVAGFLLGAAFPFDAFAGQALTLKGFVVVIIGGLGSIPGAVIAALLLGFVETGSTALGFDQWSAVVGVVLMFAILAWRPSGLLSGIESSDV